MKKIILVFFTVTFCTNLFAQNNFFTDAGANRQFSTTGQRVITPQKYRANTLNIQGMKNFLWSLPSEKNISNRSTAPVVELPMPDGTMATFRVWESSIQEAGLAEKFPEIRTFAGQGISDPYATIRFDIGPNGFHAQVLTVNGTYYIDPYSRGEVNNYISYFRTDYKKSGTFLCEVPDNPTTNSLVTEAACRGTELRTYRLAVACTGEYAQAPGIAAGSNAAVLHAAIVTTVNRVVGVYEKELSIRMVLVVNNNLVEFLNAATDPFTGNNDPSVLINESQTVIDANIGAANYDIGHTFSTGGGGLAQLGSVCGTAKARGITGLPTPAGDQYDIDFVAHEMGHQFGSSHSFNGQVGNCSGANRNGPTAYEPGSGTTIMAYAGICGSDDIQPNSDPNFHTISFDEISNFVLAGGNCAVKTPTGNTLPVIDPLPNNGVTIPVNTPFTLMGSATDANADALTYCWEEWDLGPQDAWNSGATSTTAPLFKSRVPKTTGSRTFPDISVILAGYPIAPAATLGGLKGETLPQVARAMKFRLSVRDNRVGGGGVVSAGNGGCQSSAVYQINVAGTSPFAVTLPNGGEIYFAGSAEDITWDPASTAAAPISVANVKISLSVDGGLTYPIILTASTPNDGSEVLTIPSVVSATARIKIEAVGNIFFDISNTNFTINAAPASGFNFSAPAPATAACPAAGPIDISLGTIPFGGFSNTITLTASAAPAGTTVSFVPGNTVTPGNSVTVRLSGTSALATGSYKIIITGTAAGNITKTRIITYIINPGAGPVISAQPASQTVCSGSNATFNIVSVGTYQWQVSTIAVPAFTNIPGATAAALTLTSVTTDLNGNQYRVVINGQCGISTSNAATLTVRQLPTVGLTAATLLSLLPGQITTLTATPSAQTTGTLTTVWLFNGSPVSNTGDIRIVNIENTGTYQVNIQEVFAGGFVCSNQSPAVVITAKISNKLFIFPSPNNGQFTVSYYNNGGTSTTRTVTVYDSKGSRIRFKTFPITGPYTLLSIDVRPAQKGIYFVVVGDANGKVLADGKVLVQ